MGTIREMSDNVQKFIELYNIFDDLLRQRFNEPNRSNSCIMRYVHKLEHSSSIASNKKARKINMIRVLRNSLVHEFDLNSEDLITISDDTIKFLEDEIEELKNPITAFSIATKTNQLFVTFYEKELKTVLRCMKNYGFTQVPILDDSKKLLGVFSPNVIFSYMAKHELKDQDNALTIEAFKEFLPIQKHISEKYEFIDRDADIDDVLELFDSAYRNNKKLVAIFVTEHGEPTESILGMIVPYDLLKIRNK